MDRDTLLTYPYVVLRLACRYCARAGSYRLVRLAAKFGWSMVTRTDIIVLSLDKNGDVTESITGIAGLTNFTQPLDITEDAASGCVYVAEYGGKQLSLLRPIKDEAKLADGVRGGSPVGVVVSGPRLAPLAIQQ